MTDEQPPQRSLEEIQAAVRAFRRAQRDDQIRRGKRAPRTQRETEIWIEGVHERLGVDYESSDDA